jgi:hypothetical protein
MECQQRERESKDLRREVEEIRMEESLINLEIRRRENTLQIHSNAVENLENQRKHIENVSKLFDKMFCEATWTLITLLINEELNFTLHRQLWCDCTSNFRGFPTMKTFLTRRTNNFAFFQINLHIPGQIGPSVWENQHRCTKV